MSLTPKQERFVQEYLVDLNATQAAIRAGYSAKTAEQMGYQLLQKTSVQEAIKVGRAHLAARVEITQERVLEEYAKIAFFDPRDVFTDTGAIKPIGEWPPGAAAAISAFDVAEIGDDGDTIGMIKKLKLIDKKGALDSLARHLGMFRDKVEISVDESLAERLARAKERGA